MAREMNESEKLLYKSLKEIGRKYTAEYVAKYGMENMSPNFWNDPNKAEEFYKTCITEGHPWDYYQDAPPEDSIL